MKKEMMELIDSYLKIHFNGMFSVSVDEKIERSDFHLHIYTPIFLTKEQMDEVNSIVMDFKFIGSTYTITNHIPKPEMFL